MTDPTPPDHRPDPDGLPGGGADDEVISAYLDGDATDAEVARVESNPRLVVRAAEMAAAVRAIGAEVPPPSSARRDRAVAAALDALAAPGHDLQAPSPRAEGDESKAEELVAAPPDQLAAARRKRTERGRRWFPAVAAVVLAVALGIPALLALSNLDRGDEDLATGAPDSTSEESTDDATDDAAGEGAQEGFRTAPQDESESAGSPPGGPVQLGSFDDVDALVTAAEARPDLALEATVPTAGTDPLSEGEAPGGGRDGGLDASPEQRCDGVLRSVRPDLGALTATAGATVAGEPVLVLRYALDGGGADRYVVTVTSCDVLDARRQAP